MEVFERDGAWLRVCPQCDCEVTHTNKYNALAAVKNGRLCAECGTKRRRSYLGENNPFYGKKHRAESINTMREKNAAQVDKWKTDEFRQKQREIQLRRSKGGFQYRSLEYWWIQKYGEEIAAQKMTELRRKQSEANAGKNNSMYGKPSPSGSGNGWKGHFNGRFFRSLRELKFMIDHPDAQSAEGNKFRASYEWNGKDRTTMPDFVDEFEKVVYECKPLRLIGTPLVTAKANAVERHVASLGYGFVILDPGVLPLEEFRSLIDSGDIVLTAKTMERYLKWLGQ